MQTVNIDSAALTGLFLEKLLQIADKENVNMTMVLERLGLSRSDFLIPERRFTYRQLYSLVEMLEDEGNVAGVGFKLGHKEGPLSEGFLGYACVSAANLRQSIETYIRFVGDMGLDIVPQLRVAHESAVLSFTERYPLGRHLKFSIEEIFSHILTLGKQLRGGRIQCISASLTYSEPEYSYMYRDILQCPVSFDQPINQISFAKGDLDTPFLTANETIYRICVCHCETIYKRMAKTGNLADEIKRILINMAANPPKLDSIAKQLNMTSRTLRRHLTSENTSFQEILFDVRMTLAADYLSQTAASPREIAYYIGYQEVASFYRNFKRWSGLTPKQFREKHEV